MRFFLGRRVGPFFVGVSQRVRIPGAFVADFIIVLAIILIVLIVFASRP